MKKTLTAILALVFAFAAIFAISCVAFADEETSAAAASTEAEIQNGRETTTVTTTVTTTASTTASTTAASTVSTTKLQNNSESDTASVVSNTGTTINANNITVGSTSARSTAAVVSNVPHTGSSIAVPAVAVLALLCGTVAVVKTKKD